MVLRLLDKRVVLALLRRRPTIEVVLAKVVIVIDDYWLHVSKRSRSLVFILLLFSQL